MLVQTDTGDVLHSAELLARSGITSVRCDGGWWFGNLGHKKNEQLIPGSTENLRGEGGQIQDVLGILPEQ